MTPRRFALALLPVLALSAVPAAHAQTPAATAPAATPPTNAAPSAAPAVGAPLNDAWYGAWVGVVLSPTVDGAKAIPEMPIALLVERGESKPTVSITIVRAGALAKSADDVVTADRTIAFTLNSNNRKARFEGTIDEGNASMMGSFAFVAADGSFVQPLARWTMHRVNLISEVPTARTYKSVLEVAGQKIPMNIAIGEGSFGWCGAMDIPVQGLRNFAMDVKRTETGFTLVLEVAARATITLTASADQKTLEGTFAQGGFVGPIRFEEVVGEKLGAARRPQDPTPPFPYSEREVKIAHPAGHTLVGTLAMPQANEHTATLARDGRVPAIVMVSGSGPQDRDESLLGHRPFAVLSDALVRAGIAVLRYDDRGIGSSTGDFNKATTFDLASDADFVSEWLKQQDGIDPTRVGMLGHSEGGAIAPIVSVWQNAGDAPVNPLAFMVLLAPPAELGGTLLTHQTKQLYDAAGIPSETSAPAVAAHAATMKALIERRPNDEVRVLVDALVRAQLIAGGQPLPDDATLKQVLDGALAQIMHPWMAEFIRFDPRAVLSRIEVPTLAMCGTKDVQVDAATNLGLLNEIASASGAPIVTRSCDGLNHLFQPATTGSVEEYAVIETTFDPAALAAMVAWVVETAAHTPKPHTPEATRAALNDDADLPARIYVPGSKQELPSK